MACSSIRSEERPTRYAIGNVVARPGRSAHPLGGDALALTVAIAR